MPRLSNAERNQAVGMLQAGQSKRQVARHFHCSPSTVSRLWQRYLETDSVDDRPRPGREKVTTPEQDQYIVTQHLRDRFRTATQTAAETASHGSAPVRSAAGSTRSTWALAHLRLSHFWHHLGNKTVSTGPGYTKTGLRFNGEVSSSLTNRCFVCAPSTDVKECGDDLERGMPPAAYISTTDGEVRVWWCGQPSRSITSRPWWSSKGIWLRYVTSLKYSRPTLLPLLAQHRDVITFQQDNARPHTARITMAFIGEHVVNVLPWPAYSPDMSPIEHLWDQLGRRIRNLNPRPLTRPQLIAALHAEWANIPQDNIRRLIRSMRRRCRACVAQHGGHTPYWLFADFCFRNLSKINVIKYSWCHNFEILFVGMCWYISIEYVT